MTNPLPVSQLANIDITAATTVDLFIFGTAEPATTIMAASIPILRTLIRREPQPKPARFIELDANCRTTVLPPAAEPLNDAKAKDNTEETWSKVSHLEQAHVRGPRDKGYRDDRWDDDGL